MKVSNDEVGIAQLPVNGDAENMPIVRRWELKEKRDGEHLGLVKWVFPPSGVRARFTIFFPVGTAMAIEPVKHCRWSGPTLTYCAPRR